VLLTWAWLFKLEEVSTGTVKVIPSSKEQTIQSLEGGILTKLNVKEGEIVEQGQILAQLDPTRLESNVGESESFLISSRATSARLKADVNGTTLVFPPEVLKDPK
ncbi:biotin/lipoyl-binding protein, partial [Acinetobacter wanghuae]|uniref:biotin/lipoyl-binding protein n=1 Tax=Acinetobacter wanghuae TaxID=2662362 RepID=UPI003AF8DC1B